MYQIVCTIKGENEPCLTVGPFESRYNAEVRVCNLPVSANYESIQIVDEDDEEEEDD
jgi:hypothetical protein